MRAAVTQPASLRDQFNDRLGRGEEIHMAAATPELSVNPVGQRGRVRHSDVQCAIRLDDTLNLR